MTCWHLTLASAGRLPLFDGEARLRAAVRVLARAGAGRLVLFCVVDDHVHAVVRGGRREAGRVGYAVWRGLQAVAATPVERTRVRPVESRAHLQWLVRYVLGQVQHHGLDTHPALWSGSCLQDLVGARAVLRLRLRLSELLPRLRLRTVYEHAGLPHQELAPAPDHAVRLAGAARLAEAAAAALAVDPALQGNTAPTVQARQAACALAREAGMPLSEVAWALRITPRAARRLAWRGVDATVRSAVRLRLALEDLVGSRCGRPAAFGLASAVPPTDAGPRPTG